MGHPIKKVSQKRWKQAQKWELAFWQKREKKSSWKK